MATENTVTSIEMSDEEFLAQPEPDFSAMEEVENAETGATGEEDSTEKTAEETDNSDEEAGKDGQTSEESVDSAEDSTEEENTEENGDAFSEEDQDSTDSQDGEETEEEDTDEETSDDEKASDTSETDENERDNDALVKEIFGTFKAAGQEMQVNSVEEARSLMQRGVDYNRKMAAIRPSLKTLKMLENNDLLDDSKLSHLIDLSKGDKGAIRKLLQDHKIDSMDLDSDDGAEYKPNTYTVDDRQLDLDNVLDEIKSSEHYSKTIEIIGNKWDEASRDALREKPANIQAIHAQVGNGIYDLIQAEMQRQDNLGVPRGTGSDFERYMDIGNQLHSKGAFNHILTPQPAPPAASTEKPVEATKPAESAEAKAAKEEARKAKKRAASSATGRKAANKTPIDYNPLALSDEEYEKQFGNL